jgi:hypothetical protein
MDGADSVPNTNCSSSAWHASGAPLAAGEHRATRYMKVSPQYPRCASAKRIYFGADLVMPEPPFSMG